jgi:hypothetical protein
MQDVQDQPRPEHLSLEELERYSWLRGPQLPAGWGDALIKLLYKPLTPAKNPQQLELFPDA